MKLFYLSLGCDKNLCDSEHMLAHLNRAGFTFTDSEEEADVAIVNTCAFIGDAKEESIREILRLAEYKKTGRLKALVVSGCLSERYHEEFPESLPEIDGCVGINDWDKIVSVVEEALSGAHPAVFSDQPKLPGCAGRILSSGTHASFLKIAEGCDKRCTYCAIPLIRGSYRSIPMDELLSEAESLVEKGVRELTLVAQETTLYGTDLYGKKSLPLLLQRLSDIPDLHWIRLMYCYPEEITEEIVEAIRDLPKVVKYLDIPVQHGSDQVLRRMNRKTTGEEILRTVERLRKAVPGIALRTTVMTGFPQETEEEFKELLSFVEKARFDRLGVFAYSAEENTPAYLLKPKVPKKIRESRKKQVLLLQQKIAFEKNASRVGTVTEVMVEGKLDTDDVYVCRTVFDAPDVDGYLFLETDRTLFSGDFLEVRVTGCEGYDLIGEVLS